MPQIKIEDSDSIAIPACKVLSSPEEFSGIESATMTLTLKNRGFRKNPLDRIETDDQIETQVYGTAISAGPSEKTTGTPSQKILLSAGGSLALIRS